MRVLILGSGAREHAIIKEIAKNKSVEKIFALPENKGFREAESFDIDIMDKEKVCAFAKSNNIDYCIVSPDDPLAIGMVDYLEERNIACFGPKKAAAKIESSKLFAKEFMDRHNIPTAPWKAFSDSKSAIEYVKEKQLPIVIKADGLAKGKGVVIAKSFDEAKDTLIDMLDNRRFGKSSEKIIIEDCISGPEVSVLCLVDGKNIAPLVSAMDHKRALDNDEGENTGGMGAVAPNPYYDLDLQKYCNENIFKKTIEGLKKEGIEFKGCLFVGLMLTKEGPKVLEYNARFGDPETQALMQLIDFDLLSALMACTKGELNKIDIKTKTGSACCVVAASKGYPKDFEKGNEISINEDIDAEVYMAGVKEKDGKLVNAGGRVLCVCTRENSLKEAIDKAYREIKKVKFSNIYYRSDIGKKALLVEEK